jgi:outer membrane protein assembly complex protein YaeT
MRSSFRSRWRGRRAARWLRNAILLVLFLIGRHAGAEALDALDPTRDWRVRRVRISGNQAIPTRRIRDVMVTRARPWYKFWRSQASFDPIAFGTDLGRIEDLYRRNGYYHALVGHDVEVPARGDVVTAIVNIKEGPPVRVVNVDVGLSGVAIEPGERKHLLGELPLSSGATFTEDAYNGVAARLRAYYRERGYARATVAKRATVDVRTNTATVVYRVDSGPKCVFGEVRVEGAEKVAEPVIRREVAFTPGRLFEASRLDQTRDNLLGLKLFRTVSVREESGVEPRIDVLVRVREQPPREIGFGVGFDTEDGLRGSANWRHWNFLGGARQLGANVKASFIEQAIAADFLQPHFPVAESRTAVVFGQARQEEDTFTLDRTRVGPRIDFQVTPALTAYVSHRYEYDALSNVDDAIEAKLPGIAPGDGYLSGMALGLQWKGSDAVKKPTQEWVTLVSVEPTGGFLGGDFEFIRLTWEGRAYRRLLGRLVGASRLRLGAVEPVGSSDEIPLFERFYSGGINSVRGYGRRRIGPRIDDNPIGGRTLVEMSVELRHPVRDKFTGVVFLDGGQVALDSYDFPLDDLRYGTGLGVRYDSPVGPISLDLGFPVQPPGNDQRWQVHVSLGSTF